MQEENLKWKEEKMIDYGIMKNGWMIIKNLLQKID